MEITNVLEKDKFLKNDSNVYIGTCDWIKFSMVRPRLNKCCTSNDLGRMKMTWSKKQRDTSTSTYSDKDTDIKVLGTFREKNYFVGYLSGVKAALLN